MRKTNEELDALIAEQEALVSEDAAKVNVHRGHVGRDNGQLIKNRREAIRILENRKELTTVKLRSEI